MPLIPVVPFQRHVVRTTNWSACFLCNITILKYIYLQRKDAETLAEWETLKTIDGFEDLKSKWKEYIKMDLKGNRMREWECVDWIQLAQNTDQWLSVMTTIMKFKFP